MISGYYQHSANINNCRTLVFMRPPEHLRTVLLGTDTAL